MPQIRRPRGGVDGGRTGQSTKSHAFGQRVENEQRKTGRSGKAEQALVPQSHRGAEGSGHSPREQAQAMGHVDGHGLPPVQQHRCLGLLGLRAVHDEPNPRVHLPPGPREVQQERAVPGQAVVQQLVSLGDDAELPQRVPVQSRRRGIDHRGQAPGTHSKGGGAPPPPQRNAELLYGSTRRMQHKNQQENGLVSGLKMTDSSQSSVIIFLTQSSLSHHLSFLTQSTQPCDQRRNFPFHSA